MKKQLTGAQDFTWRSLDHEEPDDDDDGEHRSPGARVLPCPRPETVDSTPVTGLCILSSLCIKWRRCADVFLCCCLLYTALYMTGCNYAVSLSVFTNLDGNTVSRHAWRGRAGSVEETLREKSERAANKRLNGDKKKTRRKHSENVPRIEFKIRSECRKAWM